MNKYILALLATVATVSAQVTNTAPAAPAAAAARTAARSSGGDYTTLIIWVVVTAAIFGFLWYKGYLIKIRNYVAETKEELRKCTWPSREELKGSTVVVMVTIAILGLFTVSVDWVLSMCIRLIT